MSFIGVNLSFIRLEFNKIFVPWIPFWIYGFHTDHRVVVSTVNVVIPRANILKSLLDCVLISKPAFLIVVLLDHEGHRIAVDKLNVEIGLPI